MWLINAFELIENNVFQLEYFPDERNLTYAILSHRWESGEISYEQVYPVCEFSKVRARSGFFKIASCCRQALRDGCKYVWVDTCCIDKRSSAELQEAINSMWRWYSKAKVCHAYLVDVDSLPDLSTSKWFKRGWTLQELLAPGQVDFFSSDWSVLGDRRSLSRQISSITNIDEQILDIGFSRDKMPLIAQIMSWARGRETTRIEDRAYSLMGFFDVNMPMLYGEGEKAFIRLQEEIIKNSDDQSLFAWEGWDPSYPGLLAKSPDQYPVMMYTGIRSMYSQMGAPVSFTPRGPHDTTSQGLSLALELVPFAGYVYLAILNYEMLTIQDKDDRHSTKYRHGIFIRRLFLGRDWKKQNETYARVQHGDSSLWVGRFDPDWPSQIQSISIVKRFPTAGSRLTGTRIAPAVGFSISVLDRKDGKLVDMIGSVKIVEKWCVRTPNTNTFVIEDGRSGVVAALTVGGTDMTFSRPMHIMVGFRDFWVPHCLLLDEVVNRGRLSIEDMEILMSMSAQLHDEWIDADAHKGNQEDAIPLVQTRLRARVVHGQSQSRRFDDRGVFHLRGRRLESLKDNQFGEKLIETHITQYHRGTLSICVSGPNWGRPNKGWTLEVSMLNISY